MQAVQVRLFGSGIAAELYTRSCPACLSGRGLRVRECRKVNDDRRATLRALVDLAMADDPVPCYDGAMAERLLRSQSSREELAEIGVDAMILEKLWPSNE